MTTVFVVLLLCSTPHPDRCELHRQPYAGTLASCRVLGWQGEAARFLADRPGLELRRATCETGEGA